MWEGSEKIIFIAAESRQYDHIKVLCCVAVEQRS